MTKTLAILILMSSSTPVEVETSSPHDSVTKYKISNSNVETSRRPAFATAVIRATNGTASAPASVRTRASRERILRRRRALRGGQQQAMGELISLIQTNVASDSWTYGGGFSGANGAGAGNGSNGTRQNAENLAELIQQTVRPLTWEINGGSGTISIFTGNWSTSIALIPGDVRYKNQTGLMLPGLTCRVSTRIRPLKGARWCNR